MSSIAAKLKILAAATKASSNYVKYTDYATSEKAGLVKVPDDSGIELESDGSICVKAATEAEIDAGTETCRPIVPSNLDYAVKACTTAEVSEDQTAPVESQAVKSALDQLKAEMKEQSVPHTTVSDYPVVLTDALAGERLRECRIYGSAAGVGDADGDAYKIPVRVCGKNLFDKDNATYLIGYFNRNTTGITTHANARTIYIPCKPNTTYTISRNTSYSNFHFGYTTELPAIGVAVSGVVGDATSKITSLTLTTGANAKYLVSYIYNGYLDGGVANAWDTIIGGIQIEQGTTATEYEEYKGSTATATLSTQLADGEYIDVINKKRYASDGTQTDITVEGELKTIESGSITIDCTTQVQPPKIDVEYLQDINKTINNLISATLTQGGDV